MELWALNPIASCKGACAGDSAWGSRHRGPALCHELRAALLLPLKCCMPRWRAVLCLGG